MIRFLSKLSAPRMAGQRRPYVAGADDPNFHFFLHTSSSSNANKPMNQQKLV
jgi:hypothetical protein